MPLIHTHTHTDKVPISLSGAIWGLVSCSGTLQHTQRVGSKPTTCHQKTNAVIISGDSNTSYFLLCNLKHLNIHSMYKNLVFTFPPFAQAQYFETKCLTSDKKELRFHYPDLCHYFCIEVVTFISVLYCDFSSSILILCLGRIHLLSY